MRAAKQQALQLHQRVFIGSQHFADLTQILCVSRSFPMGDRPDSPLRRALLSLTRGAIRVRLGDMTEVYFHCADADHLLIDHCGAALNDFSEVCAHADRFVRALVTAPNSEDWRGWELRVTDALGDEILVIPFASVLGRLH
jgi:hypothetical protein